MNKKKEIIKTIFTKYPRNPSSLIMILQDIQTAFNYLPQTAISQISIHLNIPQSQIYSVVTFYKHFSLTQLGNHRINVCMGTACHVRGSERLVEQISSELYIKPGETTENGELTLNKVHCVGACAMGPVVVIDGKFHGEMTPVKLSKSIKKCCIENNCKGSMIQETAVDYQKQKHKNANKKLVTLHSFEKIRDEIIQRSIVDQTQILVCAGTGCLARGSLAIAEKFKKEIKGQNVDASIKFQVKKTGCHGLCEKGPLITFHPRGLYYTNVKVDDVKEIVQKTVIENNVVQRLLYTETEIEKQYEKYQSIPFYSTQKRHVLRRVGLIDPEDIRDYIAHGGYTALHKALSSLTPDSVIDEIVHSGLRGRGGGGFSTGKKWQSCVNTNANDRYIICNGDEGDPGAFMDCSIMEGDPHAIIEGMVIGAFAINAHHGYIYVREEYPRALKRIIKAIDEAKEWNFLGDSILGTGFSFNIKIARGAGAFVCGESSALMQSIAGNVGEPRAKYIRSVEQGLYCKPTVLNNVETFANIPLIIEKGAKWFSSSGTEKSKGTKVFSIVGKVQNSGLVEVPMGTTLRSIIFDTCGGILNGKSFKAVQTGGPSGGCLPESKLDLPVDFDTLTSEGSMMGSGGMIIMDEKTCMIDVAYYFTNFLTEESCGKCSACRMGLSNLKEILQKVRSGNGTPDDILEMERLFSVLEEGSLCGLGKSAVNPVRSTLIHFRDEYEAHIGEKKCPAGVCRDLITYLITPSCTGCRICAKNCPQNAISGTKKEIHIIDTAKCNRCGICEALCQFDSIAVV